MLRIALRCLTVLSLGGWVSYYKHKLSLRAVLVGVKKGRSVKALRERVEILQGHDDTAHLGRQLAQYLEKVYIAQRWRGGKL